MVYKRQQKYKVGTEKLKKLGLVSGRWLLATLIFSSLVLNWPALPFLSIPRAEASFPSVVTTSKGPTSGTSNVLTLPTGIASGNLLVAIFANSGGGGQTWPSGWHNMTLDGGICGNEYTEYKIADGTEGSSITVNSGNTGEGVYNIYRITGWHGTTPPEATAVSTGAATTSPNPPSLTPSWGSRDTLWIAAIISTFTNTDVTAFPTNYTNGIKDFSSGGGSCMAASARRTLNAASEDPGPFTVSASVFHRAITIAVPPPPPAITQRAYRFYEDGTESGASAAASQDTTLTRTVDSDSNIELRVSLQETGGNGGLSTDDYQLQYSKNGGAYTSITTGTSNVKGFNSASLTDAGATSNRGSPDITDPVSGSFVAGKISEDGLLDDHQLTASNYTEHLYSLTLIAADLSNNDSLDFRVLYNGATTQVTYSSTPRIIVQKNTPTTADQLRGGIWFKGQVKQGFYWAN